jgi:hypothetical protein
VDRFSQLDGRCDSASSVYSCVLIVGRLEVGEAEGQQGFKEARRKHSHVKHPTRSDGLGHDRLPTICPREYTVASEPAMRHFSCEFAAVL